MPVTKESLAITKIVDAQLKSDVCNTILRALPLWFGIESSIVDYVNDVKTMDTWVAELNNEFIGFISINKHNEFSAEIHVIGVLEKFHRNKIGQLLVETAESALKLEGFKFLQVKTLSELRTNAEYEKTRMFYLKMGFTPIEVFKTLWGEHNPCLQMLKHIRTNQVRAVMIHVTDVAAGRAWYEKAFSSYKKVSLPQHNFEYLDINGTHIEIVQADTKVSSGTCGTVAYWNTLDFEKTKAHLESIGATLYRGPMSIENNQKMCQFKDPFGNLIGIRGL